MVGQKCGRCCARSGRDVAGVNVGHVRGTVDDGHRISVGLCDSPFRLEQARKLAGMVEHVRPFSDVTVLCGDLNLLPSSETFTLLAEHGMTDLVGEADTRTSIYTKPIRSAGYLLVSSPAAVRSFEIIATPEVSDHRALMLEI